MLSLPGTALDLDVDMTNLINNKQPKLILFFRNTPVLKREANMKIAELLFLKVDPFTLTLKAPIMTAADDIHKYFFIVFQRK